MNKICVIILMFYLYGYSAIAEQPYKIEYLEKTAIKNSPSIKAIYYEWQAVVAKIASMNTLPDPKISFTEFVEEVQTRVGPQRRKVSLMQMFPWFGELKLKEKIQFEKANLVEQKIKNKKLELINKLRVTLYELNLLRRKIQIYSKHLELISGIEKSSKGHIKSGKGHLSSILKIQIEKGRIADEIKSLQGLVPPYLKKVEKILGETLVKPLPQKISPNPIDLNKTILINRFKKNNPKWIINQNLQNLSKNQIKMAKLSGKPNFGVGISWIDTGPSLMPNTKGSGDDPVALTLSVNLPIWRGKINSKIKSANHTYESHFINQQNILDKFIVELDLLIFKIKNSKRKSDLYSKELLPKTKSAYQSTANAYKIGKVSFQNLVDAERLVLRISLDYEIALFNYKKYNSELIRLIGG